MPSGATRRAAVSPSKSDEIFSSARKDFAEISREKSQKTLFLLQNSDKWQKNFIQADTIMEVQIKKE